LHMQRPEIPRKPSVFQENPKQIQRKSKKTFSFPNKSKKQRGASLSSSAGAHWFPLIIWIFLEN